MLAPPMALLPHLPPGVVALIGARLAAPDRAAVACAARRFRAVHDAVEEEDAWPPTRAPDAPAAPYAP